jgi:hypothetical protein
MSNARVGRTLLSDLFRKKAVGAPSFPRSLREGGGFDFLPSVSCPVKVKIPALSPQKTARQGRGTLMPASGSGLESSPQ